MPVLINGPLVCQKAEDLTKKNGKRQLCSNRKMVSMLEDKEKHLFKQRLVDCSNFQKLTDQLRQSSIIETYNKVFLISANNFNHSTMCM